MTIRPTFPASLLLTIPCCLALGVAALSVDRSSAQEPAASPSPAPRSGYSEEVLAKAQQVLSDAGLRRQTKAIISQRATELSRQASDLSKKHRSVQQATTQFQSLAAQLQRIGEQLRVLNLQTAELNDRLVTLRGDIATNNRLVASINRNGGLINELRTQRDELRDRLNQARQDRVNLETEFAAAVTELREQVGTLLTDLEEKLADPQLLIAIRVLHHQFQTPEKLELADLIGALDRRVKHLEKQIQQEAITLVPGEPAGLMVPVTVEPKTLNMVLDSGSALTILPAATATELGITVPATASEVRLVLADGTQWHGKVVTIAKMRVGTFEASDVEAAVLEPAATLPEPILGQSFLGQFQHTIDRDAGELRLMRVTP